MNGVAAVPQARVVSCQSVLTQSDLAIGLEAARLNLRLAEELNKPEKAKANAFWALAAHQLAAGQYQPAIDAFLAGKTRAALAEDAVLGHMLDGYAAMARILGSPEDAAARAAFDTAVAALKADNSEDAREYGNQLLSVLVFFQPET